MLNAVWTVHVHSEISPTDVFSCTVQTGEGRGETTFGSSPAQAYCVNPCNFLLLVYMAVPTVINSCRWLLCRTTVQRHCCYSFIAQLQVRTWKARLLLWVHCTFLGLIFRNELFEKVTLQVNMSVETVTAMWNLVAHMYHDRDTSLLKHRAVSQMIFVWFKSKKPL